MMFELLAEVARELCVENLKEKDRDLNFTGKYKKCYDYLAEQFIRNYVNGKSMFDIIDGTQSGKFYNTWKGFLCGVKYVVEGGGKFHGSLARGIEDMVNNSGISRKFWVKFLNCYFPDSKKTSNVYLLIKLLFRSLHKSGDLSFFTFFENIFYSKLLYL